MKKKLIEELFISPKEAKKYQRRVDRRKITNIKPVKAWAIIVKEAKEKKFDVLGYTRLYVYVGQKRGKEEAKKDRDFYRARKGYNYKIIPCEIRLSN